MDFVDGPWRIERVRRAAPLHPILVLPLIRQVPDPGCGRRRRFPETGERIALVDAIAVESGFDMVFIGAAMRDAGYESLPDPRTVRPRLQRMGAGIPVVEV